MGDLFQTALGLIIIFSLALGCTAAEPTIVLQNEHQSLTAEFTASISTGSTPLSIYFTDMSSGSPDEWLWDFGDGNQDTVQNPVHIYTEPGVFSVSLTVTGNSGTDKKTRLGYITVKTPITADPIPEQVSAIKNTEAWIGDTQKISTPLPTVSPTISDSPTPLITPSPEQSPVQTTESNISSRPDISPSIETSETDLLNLFNHPIHANFTPSVISGKEPLEVHFSDESTGDGSDWSWDFGDGTMSDTRSPDHTYLTPGIYSVRLTVQGQRGSDSMLKTDLIEVASEPGASFNAQPRSGSAPLTVAFTDNSSGRIKSQVWSFGDGTSSNEKNPIHSYTKPGIFDVKLVVSGPDGSAEDTIPALVSVTEKIQEPVADINTDVSAGPAPLTVRFTDNSSGDVSIRTWYFGDGTTASEPTITHTYTKAGTYTVNLAIKGSAGESKTEATILVTETTKPPQANFTMDQNQGPAPFTVIFKDTSSGLITEWNWDFGDGITASGQNQQHTYMGSGTYTPVLTVKGSTGESRTETTITVTSDQVFQIPPTAIYTTDNTEGNAPLTITFTDTSSGTVTGWNWDFGDGTTVTGQNQQHIYTEAGTYTPVLTITGPAGEDRTEKTIIVSKSQEQTAPPKAAFKTDLNEGVSPLTINFTEESTGTVTGWNWDFGDGFTAEGQNQQHIYTGAGTYTPVLTITGPAGEDRTEKTIIVSKSQEQTAPPKAAFTTDLNEGVSPLTINFTEKSTGTVTGWNWDFGDGSTAIRQNQQHIYTRAGIYTPVLSISGPGGEDRVEKTIIVSKPPKTLSPLKAVFTTDLNEGVAPLTIVFSDASIGPITGWNWDFGDGITATGQNQLHTYPEAGTYTAVLIITGQTGEDRTEKTITVSKSPEQTALPKAAFTTDMNEGPAPLIIAFTDASTGSVTGWNWDFGDGTTATGQNQQHTYSGAGTFTAVLTTTGPDGDDRTEKTIIVSKLQEQTAPPKAAFTTDLNEGPAPLTIAFSDVSTGPLSGWNWDFGDGTTGVGQNQQHTYTIAGTYTASLTISGPGGEDRAEQIIQIIPSKGEPKKEQLKAAFSTYSSQGPAPFTTTFLDTSSGEISSWKWDFGDGASSSEQSPKHTYTTPGTYPAYLTVTGPSGESRTDATLVLVSSSLSQPWAAITTDQSDGYAPLSIRFSDSSSGEITEWNWDFGDGATASGNQSDHAYITPGSYSATLTVKGPGGESRSETLIHVKEPEAPPIAELKVSVTQGQTPLNVTFTDSSSGTITRRNWDFGDGVSAAEQNSTHTYTNPGTYKAVLSIEGPGGVGRADQTITVTEGKKKPSADFTTDITNGSLPLRVHLHPVTTGEVEGYFWDLGDGTISYDKEPVHIYETLGNYQVSLTVSGPGGVTTIKKPGIISTIPTSLPDEGKPPAFIPEPTTSVTQNPDIPVHQELPDNTTNQSTRGSPVITITGDYSSGPAPLHTSFQTNVTGIIDGYVWDFGDGGSSYDPSPVHVYAKPGNYSVKLIVTGPNGISEVKVPDPIMVTEGMQIPVAGFSADPTSGYIPMVVNFTDHSSGSIDEYLWNLGDGTTSTEKNPQHQYTFPGSYSVGLKVSGQSGSSEEEKTDLIIIENKPAPPVARFKADTRTGRSPLVVSFQDMASGAVSSWSWDLGDGNVSSERDPVNTYNRPGVYSVSQTVVGPGGKDTAIRRGFITVSEPKSPPSAAIYAEPVKGPAPLPVKFLDMSSGSISSWNWDLGDGTNSTDKNPNHIFQNPGTYKIRLQVDGPEGQSTSEMVIRVSSSEEQVKTETIKKNMSVLDIRKGTSYGVSATPPIKPIANFTVSGITGTAPLKVAFQDISTGEITQWVWSFGNGEFSNIKDPVYTYQKPGTYTVSLTVSGPHGSSSKRSRETIEVS